MGHQEHKSYTYVLPLKYAVHWKTKNIHFEKKCPKIKKKLFFLL